MALIDGSQVAKRFSNFEILQTHYKKFGDHGIRADFIIPKSITRGENKPVIIQFHGRALVSQP
jgi:cephalosporin-C deacetylase-like acetyl esterase